VAITSQERVAGKSFAAAHCAEVWEAERERETKPT
jgi:hypothetical protein